MPAGRLSTTSYVVLGMIGLRGPSTPDELKRGIGRSVGYFWPFPHAQLYAELERLERLELLAVESEDGGRGAPGRGRRNGRSLLPGHAADEAVIGHVVRDFTGFVGAPGRQRDQPGRNQFPVPEPAADCLLRPPVT